MTSELQQTTTLRWQEQLKQIIGLVWEDKWEAILGIAGFVGTILSTNTPIWLIIILSLLTLALLIDVWRHVRKTVRLVREKPMPVVVAVGKSDEVLESMIDDIWELMDRPGFNEQQFKREWGVQRNDMVTHEDRTLTDRLEDWHHIARRFRQKLERLDTKLKRQRVYHLFLNCPAAMAVGLGAQVGARYLFALYHYQQGKYYRVIDITDVRQTLRQDKATPYETIQVTRPTEPLTAEVFVSLRLSGRDLKGVVSQRAETHGASAIHIDNTFGHSLDPNKESDWLAVAREVCTELLSLIDDGRQRIHLYLNTPVILAFVVGAALGPHSPVTVYQWNSETMTYHPAILLEQLLVKR